MEGRPGGEANILAIGQAPSNRPAPFCSMSELHEYYNLAKCVVVVVGDQITDDAHSVASNLRLNGLFIIQPQAEPQLPSAPVDVHTLGPRSMIPQEGYLKLIDALAGLESLVLSNVGTRYFWLSGAAAGIPEFQDVNNRPLQLEPGEEVTERISRAGGLMKVAELLHHQGWPRVVSVEPDTGVFRSRLSNADLALSW